MFSRIAGVYDRLNRILSLGMDGGWRRAAARQVPRDARIVVDLCAGTGALARLLARPGRLVIACDASAAMLERGARTGALAPPAALGADAYRLPLADGTADAFTIAFGLRNLHRTVEALREIARVLKPGGRLIVLELAPPGRGARGALHRAFVGQVVPRLARLVTRDAAAYAYLSRSVLGCADEATLAAAMREAGLSFARAERLGGGAVHLLVGIRR